MKKTVQERFWSKVDIKAESSCWEWTAYKHPAGYGKFSMNGKLQLAHRVAFILTKGDFSSELYVCHRCDNRACCNPQHLFLGDHQVNMSDMVSKDRQAKGSENGNVKLTEQQVVEIRAKYQAGGVSYRALGKEYGVHYTQIGDIVKSKAWTHIKTAA